MFRIRGVDQIQQNPVDAWALYRIGLEFIVTMALLIRLALRRTPWLGSMFRGYVGVLAAFGVIELASSVWSVYPAWTFYKACEYLMDIALLGAVLATVQSVKAYRDLFNWTWMLYGLLLVYHMDGGPVLAAAGLVSQRKERRRGNPGIPA